ncbi:MAG TPA: hypothetical protein VF992_04700 [Thermoplasmata archaeon]
MFAKHAPPGLAYRGTFGTVLGFGRYDTALIMECIKYGDFDAFREHKDETWDRLAQESTEFVLPGQGEAMLLREIGDVKVVEPKRTKQPSRKTPG